MSPLQAGNGLDPFKHLRAELEHNVVRAWENLTEAGACQMNWASNFR